MRESLQYNHQQTPQASDPSLPSVHPLYHVSTSSVMPMKRYELFHHYSSTTSPVDVTLSFALLQSLFGVDEKGETCSGEIAFGVELQSVEEPKVSGNP
jgi:hypothetical protein